MKWLLRGLALLLLLAVIGFAVFRVPDTDPARMRAKYGGEPSQFVRIGDEAEFHLRDEGPRGALPVVLLHGSNADLHTWQPWVDRLKNEYRVIRYDQRGHGLTGALPIGDYSPEAFTSDVEAIRRKLGLERFVLAGNSMGGGVAARYAMEHPENVAGLVLIDAVGAPIDREGGGNLAFTLARMPGIGAALSQLLPRSLVERSLSQSVSNQAVVTDAAVDRYWELARYPGNRAATRARFTAPRDDFDEDAVRAIDMPVLVMWGKEDALIPYEAAGWYMERLPQATLAAYDGIGHLPMEEAAERSAGDLRRWLRTMVNRPVATLDSDGVTGER